MSSTPNTGRTHRDLMPKDLCPSLVFKQILTHGLDDVVFDDRTTPGDGYSWCLRTCKEVGLDDDFAHPDRCRPGRACYDGPTP